MKRIVVVGSSNTDMVIRVDRIPRPGETVIGGIFTMAAGGKGANQAVAAARAGANVTFVARVGADVFGQRALHGFRKEGINTAHVRREPRAASGVALIFVNREAENSIGVASGANGFLSPADVRRAENAIRSADALLVQLEVPPETVKAAVALAARHGVPVILNPAPAAPVDRRILRKVSILTPNETEAELLTGVKMRSDRGAETAARRLLAAGVRTVIITLGARGALVANSEGAYRTPGFRVTPVDTTAAGDVFNGVLAVRLAEGRPLADAVRFANAAAAISVTRVGAQPSIPTRGEIESFMRSGTV